MNTDVVIVGAGPVGLWLAAEVRRAGLEVIVLERRTELVTQSRALTIHGRTLEIFGLRGLAPRFLAEGRPMSDWHFAGLESRLQFSGFDSPHPYTLFIPQSVTERLLEEHALELGVQIRRGVTVTAVDTHADGVTIDTDDGTTVTARYGVGADGARSIVRRSTGIEFPGLSATDSIAMGDVVLELPNGRQTWGGENRHGGGNIIPSGDGVHSRVIVLDVARRHVPQREPLTLDELAESCRRTMGSDFGMRDASWLTRFTNETRIADHYRHGNLFLVGDAAHIHAPMGGQGLNVGIHDAMNLGWKLAEVLAGGASDALLDSYEGERRPVGQRLFANTAAQYQLVSVFDPANAHLRDVMSGLLATPEANRAMAGEISGFAVAYPEPLPGFAEEVHSGERVPDLPVTAGGETSTLHAMLSSGRWVRISGPGGPRDPLPSWISDRRIVDVSADTARGAGSRGVGGLFDGARTAVVRPDGHLAALVR